MNHQPNNPSRLLTPSADSIFLPSPSRRIPRFLVPLAVAAVSGFPAVGLASHYEIITPNDKAPIQCLVQDLRHPQWSNGHYLACYSQYFSTKEKWGSYFYGGFVANPKESRGLLQFCSWQMTGMGVPAADIAFAYAGNHMSWAKSTWEGSAGGIKGLWPESAGSQLHVKWDLSPVSCPQLGYKLEIFGTPEPTGDPLLVLSGNDPDCRSLLADLTAGAAAAVRLTLTDIYGRDSAAVVRAVTTASLQPAAKPAAEPGAGLNYCYFEAPAGTSWNQIPDFSKLTPARQGTVAEPDISPRLRRTNYAFTFNGQLQIQSAGIHHFTLVHASGAKLSIDGQTVIDASEYHSIGKFTGAIPLAKGGHAFSLQYVQGDKQLQQADDFLQLLWEVPGSGGKPAQVPCNAYSRQCASGEPRIVFTPPLDARAGRVKLSAEVTGLDRGTPARIQYYIENPAFDYFRAQGAQGGDYFIGETTAADTALTTMLWGTPDLTLRARLLYGDNRTIDSVPVTFKSSATNLGPWKLSELEHHQYPATAQVDGQAVALVGESMALLTQPVTGDCTLIARLTDITPNTPGPDGTAPEASQWQAGIILRNDLGASPGEPLGGNTQYVSLLGAADGSIRHCDSLMKNGAGNQPSGNLGSTKRWLKLERNGNRFTESLSEDGNAWTMVKTVDLPKMNPSIHAGLFIYALPSSIKLLHHATFDHVTLTPAR